MRNFSIIFISLLMPMMLFAQGSIETKQVSEISKKKNIAVLDFSTTGDISKGDVQVITERFQTELIEIKKYTVLERSKMDVILEEQGFQQSGACNTDECQVEVGQLLGVDQLVTGSVGKVGSLYTVNLKIIDVGTGEIMQSKARDFSGGLEEVVTSGCKEIAKDLLDDGTQVEESGSSVWVWVAGGVAVSVGVVLYFVLNSSESEPKDVVYN